MSSEDKDREEMARQIRHVAHNIRSRQRLALGDTEAGICERAAEVLASSSCAARDSALEEAAARCDSFAKTAREMGMANPNETRGSSATLQGLAAESCASFIRAMKGAPVPESEEMVAFHKLLQDEGEEYEGPDSTPQPEAPTPITDAAEWEYTTEDQTLEWGPGPSTRKVVDSSVARQLERKLAEAEQRLSRAMRNHGEQLMALNASRSASAATVTEEMADSVRGVLQMLRGKPGATFKDVRVHCSARGDDLSLWPVWIADCDGYVTEEAAARMIYGIMAANAPRSSSTDAKDAERFRKLQQYGGVVTVDRDGCKAVSLTLWWLDYHGGPVSHENWVESFDRASALSATEAGKP